MRGFLYVWDETGTKNLFGLVTLSWGSSTNGDRVGNCNSGTKNALSSLAQSFATGGDALGALFDLDTR